MAVQAAAWKVTIRNKGGEKQDRYCLNKTETRRFLAEQDDATEVMLSVADEYDNEVGYKRFGRKNIEWRRAVGVQLFHVE